MEFDISQVGPALDDAEFLGGLLACSGVKRLIGPELFDFLDITMFQHPSIELLQGWLWPGKSQFLDIQTPKRDSDFTNDDLLKFEQVTELLSLWCDLGHCGVCPEPLWEVLQLCKHHVPMEDQLKDTMTVTVEWDGQVMPWSEFQERASRMAERQTDAESEPTPPDPRAKDKLLEIVGAVMRLGTTLRRMRNVNKVQSGEEPRTTFSNYRNWTISLGGKAYPLTPRAWKIADLIMKAEGHELDFSKAQERLKGIDTFNERDINKWQQWRSDFNKAVAESGFKMSVLKKEQVFRIVKEFEEKG